VPDIALIIASFRDTVLSEKLIVALLIKKFLVFYGIRILITVFTRSYD